jgi:catechol 2,3-dioxygenase-like lactoylglutathione lyase family enzyme
MSVRLRVMSATLVVADVARSLDFYVATLGCVECFRVGDLPDFAAVEREALVLNLMPAARAPAARGQAHLHVMVTGLDALHADLAARGCLFEVPPTAFWYGLREFSLRDPDGNRITFGEETAPQTSPS